jgi:radical SAM superfamily enzyme YgiQ (UPF0313 family)
MTRVLLIQLPIPHLNFGKQTGNIPLGAAYLKQAVAGLPGIRADIVPESIVSYLGDAALVQYVLNLKPEIVGFTGFSWNIERSLYLAAELKAHFQPKIIFGGPEVTADNPLVHSPQVDIFVSGEGERTFQKLLQDPACWQPKHMSASPAGHFDASPYLDDLLEPEIENMMLLETQRGCPYRCAFCYYNKSRKRQAVADDETLLRSIRWAMDKRLRELYLLDPSLNIRPGLKSLLKKISKINKNGKLAIFSEIRAEAIDEELADLFVAAGFSWFEIGLQSTNSKALKVMQRPTDLQRFLRGAKLLKARNIVPQIDLIIGLPGDDIEGFGESVDFVARHDIYDDVQVFPLAILPGTEFRQRSRELGLRFEAHPPYTCIESPGFSGEDMLMAFDTAEVRLDVVFHPLPDLDIAWRHATSGGGSESMDHFVLLGRERYVAKVCLHSLRPRPELQKLARRLTQPYQIFIFEEVSDVRFIHMVLETLTSANPFVPFEIVFVEPAFYPDTADLLSAVKLQRPHYLDNEQRFLFASPGNRAVLFTLVSTNLRARFGGPMQRQIYRWQQSRLPQHADLDGFSNLDGVLIDCAVPEDELMAWQDRFANQADEIAAISFSQISHQQRWLTLTASDDYVEQMLGRRSI